MKRVHLVRFPKAPPSFDQVAGAVVALEPGVRRHQRTDYAHSRVVDPHFGTLTFDRQTIWLWCRSDHVEVEAPGEDPKQRLLDTVLEALRRLGGRLEVLEGRFLSEALARSPYLWREVGPPVVLPGGAPLRPRHAIDESLVSLWEDSSGTLWALTTHYLLRQEGQGWEHLPIHNGASRLPRMELYSLWGTGPEDLWVGGEALLHWDGRSWLRFDCGSEHRLTPRVTSLWGTAPDDVWAAGTYFLPSAFEQLDGPPRRMLLHWNGQAWSLWFDQQWVDLPPGTPQLAPDPPPPPPPPPTLLQRLRQWVRREQQPPQPLPQPTPDEDLLNSGLYTVHGSGPDQVWWAGWEVACGLVLRWQRGGMAKMAGDAMPFGEVKLEPLETEARLELVSSLHVLSPGDVWLCGKSSIHHWDGRHFLPMRWQEQTGFIGEEVRVRLQAIHARAADDVWVVGHTDEMSNPIALHWDGSTWSSVPAQGARGLQCLLRRRDGSLWAGAVDGRLYTLCEEPGAASRVTAPR